MPGYIGMNFAEVESLANALTQGAQEGLSHVSQLAARANPADVWQGDAANGYTAAFERWSTAQKAAQEALTNLSKAVNVIKTNFEEINRDGQAAFGSFYQ